MIGRKIKLIQFVYRKMFIRLYTGYFYYGKMCFIILVPRVGR